MTAPVINSVEFGVTEGNTVSLFNSYFDITDVDGDVAFTYTVSDLVAGQFEDSQGNIITVFTSDDIASGKVHFAHDGSNASPSFNIVANDGTADSALVAEM